MTASSWPGFPNFRIPDPEELLGSPATPPRRRPRSRVGVIAKVVAGLALLAVVKLALWTGFLLLLALIAGVQVTFWQAFAAGWLCVALAQTSANLTKS